MLWIAYYAEFWVYPVMQVLSWPGRLSFFAGLWVFMFIIYIAGEAINTRFWGKYRTNRHGCYVNMYETTMVLKSTCTKLNHGSGGRDTPVLAWGYPPILTGGTSPRHDFGQDQWQDSGVPPPQKWPGTRGQGVPPGKYLGPEARGTLCW